MHDEKQNLQNQPEEKKPEGFWSEFAKLVLLAAIIVVPFRLYIAQPFIVDGASMSPTFETGQYLIVDELSYHFKNPERGTVIVFKYPNNPSKYFIKRIIGLPGEEVSINNGKVTIKNEQNPDGFVLDEPYVEFSKEENSSYILGQEEYFVLGDNRAGSADSRLWGALPQENIIGKPIIRFYPLSLSPGDKSEFGIDSYKEEQKNE